ncbi:hypothetical protein HAX54_020072 [Datura stramonium]|uniref:F-box domain-containing protein n=1 Tax=Datura stramonium TaxID=4076 RepID=A0ABS8USL2_DATST|nr:hypothetical protein [Datura stramonium]
MEIKRMAMAMATARGDRLSDLPESILLHILSMLPDRKQVVRTSMLSTRWRFLWMSVPVSLYFEFPEEEEMGRPHQQILDFVTSTHRELHYWRSCQKIRDFTILFNSYQKKFIADVDLWVSFATKLANVEEFTLCLLYGPTYQFPQFAYKNKSLRSLDLGNCTLNPSANVNWRGLVSLSLRHINLMEGVMEKVLSGCPNLECLELENFSGFHSLEISSVKMRKLIITNYRTNVYDVWLEILAPHIQNLQLFWLHRGICLRNVASLVTAVINFDFDLDIKHGYQMQRKLSGCLKELLHSVAHVKNLELSPWCIECLSVLELEGWQPPPSSWKFLQLSTALKQWDFPGICRFLPSSLDLETLVINGCTYQSRVSSPWTFMFMTSC